MPGGESAGSGAGSGGTVQNLFWNLTHFFDFKFKNTSNLIFPAFKMPSKSFHSRISKQGLLFGICDFSIFKIWSEVVNISMGHPVFDILNGRYLFALFLSSVHNR